MHDATTDPPEPPRTTRRPGWQKLLVLAMVATCIAAGFYFFGDSLRLESLVQREVQLKAWKTDHPILTYVIAFLVYVAVTGLSLPGATPLTLVYGWYFGLARGVVLVSFASTAGATLAFLLSRYLLRETIESRFGDRLAAFNRNLEREGAFYLFTLRLIPAVPFFVINVVMGLTPMRTWTYWWVSQVGMLAGTVAYVFAGSTVPDLRTLADQGAASVLTPPLWAALILLGLFPLVARVILNAVPSSRSK